MNLEQATKYVFGELTEFCLKMAFQDKIRDVNYDFIEPFIVFMSQQTSAVPIGALVGALVGANQNKIPAAMIFVEALVEHGVVKAKQVNGNWIIYPVNIEHEVHPALGCDSRPLKIGKPFCGKVIHHPKPSRLNHLEHMNSISFKLNSEFVAKFPQIPETVPFTKTLPGILKTANKLHLEHKYDTRGRTYCAAHINYQGTEYEKCLMTFSKELKVTDKGRHNLIEHFNTLKPKEKYLQSVAQQAYMSERTGIFIGADASASGIQLMSVLFGCEKSAESVGLTAPNDFYTLADQKAQLQVSAGKDPRVVFKQCCMQHFYGGTKTPKEELGEENLPKFYAALQEIAPGCQKLLSDLQYTYHATEVFTWELPDGFKVQQPVIETQRVELTMPNNPQVTFGYNFKKLVKREKGLEMAANVVHSVDGFVARELIYRAKEGGHMAKELIPIISTALNKTGGNDKVGTVFSAHKLLTTPVEKWPLLGKSFLTKALRYYTSIDGMEPFDVISIHDDFKCHPNFLHIVKWLYVEILAEIADSSLIADLIMEINPALTYRKVPSTKLAEDIRAACANGTGSGLT